MNCFIRTGSPLGELVLTSDGEKLSGIWFEDQENFPSELKENYQEKELPVLKEAKEWLALYFEGNIPSFTPPLSLRGTVFQMKIWSLLLNIPYGQTITYGQLAKLYCIKEGLEKMSAQAVGQAVSRNPISIIVPCHRVIGSKGKLTGYTGGLERKETLLKLERNIALKCQKPKSNV
jgi:methylated-DNA-[protein]-cysteine S-methyltransferase